MGTDHFRAVGTSGTGHAMPPHLLQNFDNLKQLSVILKQLYIIIVSLTQEWLTSFYEGPCFYDCLIISRRTKQIIPHLCQRSQAPCRFEPPPLYTLNEFKLNVTVTLF